MQAMQNHRHKRDVSFTPLLSSRLRPGDKYSSCLMWNLICTERSGACDRFVFNLCLSFCSLPGSCGRCRQWCGFLSASCSSAHWLNPFPICLSLFQHNSTNTRFLRLLQTWVPVLSFRRRAFSSWVQPCVWTAESIIFQAELFSGAALLFTAVYIPSSSRHLSHADWGFQVWWPNMFMEL